LSESKNSGKEGQRTNETDSAALGLYYTPKNFYCVMQECSAGQDKLLVLAHLVEIEK